MSYHELTDKLSGVTHFLSADRVDEVVREYLEHKVEVFGLTSCPKKITRDILGLSEPKEPKTCCGPNRGHTGPCITKEPIVEKCEHLDSLKSITITHRTPGADYSKSIEANKVAFCPICGTKRPEELSEVEELSAKLKDCSEFRNIDITSGDWYLLAHTALTWMKGREGK